MKIISDLVNKVKKAFKSKEYRHAYVDEFLNVSIATQIKVLREQRKWTQAELASRIDPLPMKQTRISIMENVNYSSWNINTLRKLAKAFDVTLNVSFESFGNRIKDIEQFNRDVLERPSFEDDPAFMEREERDISASLFSEGYKAKGNVIQIAAYTAMKEKVRSRDEEKVLIDEKLSSNLTTGLGMQKGQVA